MIPPTPRASPSVAPPTASAGRQPNSPMRVANVAAQGIESAATTA